MADDDIKLGNPLRVACRTCKMAAGAACWWPVGQKPIRREFHGKRIRDAFHERNTYGPPLIVGVPKTQTARRKAGDVRAKAWREMRARTPIATLGELMPIERAVSAASKSALDMNDRAFWEKVWNDA